MAFDEMTAPVGPDAPLTAPSGDPLSTADDAAAILAEYWAAKQGPELWTALQQKEADFHLAAESRGLYAMTRLSFSTYFGLSNPAGTAGRWQTQSLSYAGEDGELLEFNLAEYRSFVDQIVNMTCKTRPSFQALAVNTDFASLAQVEASDSTVNYHFEQTYGERKDKEVVKGEALYGKAYTHVEWDPDGGAEVEIDVTVPSPMGALPSTKKVKTGEFRIQKLNWWQVVCEASRSEHDDHMWRVVVPAYRSKWEMIKRFPAYAAAIRDSGIQDSDGVYRAPGADPNRAASEDEVVVRIFYHAKCAVMPLGRKVIFVNDVQVDDLDLPIDEIPVYDFMSCELHGTSFGVSDLWNLIPLDQMEAQVLSDMATNVEAFSRPPLVIVEGTDIDLDALANGEKVFTVPPGAALPEPIKFPTIPEASWKMIDLIRSARQSLSGLNAISRGDTSAHVTSGAHAALYSSIAVEAQAPRSAARDLHQERVGNGILQYLKKYAEHPQMVAIAGEDERGYLKSFSQKDLAGVQRVKIRTQNPQMRTQAGRLQIAELLKDWPGQPLKDPQQIVELVVSGQFKPSYSPTRSDKLRIRMENEALLRGPQVDEWTEIDPMTGMESMHQDVPEVPVYPTDNGETHCIGHAELLCSPAAQDPKVRKAVLAHILKHAETSRGGDPYLAGLLHNPAPETPGVAPPPPQADATGGPPASKAVDKTLDGEDDSAGASLPKPAQPAKPPQP